MLEQDLEDNRHSLPRLTGLIIEAPIINEDKAVCEFSGMKMIQNNLETTGYGRLLN